MTSNGTNAHGQAKEVLARLLSDASGPVLVHSDVFMTSGAIPRVTNRQAVLSAHTSLLFEAADGRSIWMPAFNYGYLRERAFAVHEDASQVGVLTEHYRTERADWRTPVPVFSVSGNGSIPTIGIGARIDPFGADSIFAQLAEQRGSILFYGAGINSCTFVHHVEREAGGPPYRYDKLFAGTVTNPSSSWSTHLLYHVRPLGHHLDYDWSRLGQELVEHGLLRRSESRRFAVASAEAAALREFWCDRLAADPLHLLDDESRAWVEPKLQELGRRFLQSDFETGENGEAA